LGREKNKAVRGGTRVIKTDKLGREKNRARQTKKCCRKHPRKTCGIGRKRRLNCQQYWKKKTNRRTDTNNQKKPGGKRCREKTESRKGLRRSWSGTWRNWVWLKNVAKSQRKKNVYIGGGKTGTNLPEIANGFRCIGLRGRGRRS